MTKPFRNIRMQEAKDPGEYDQEGDMSMTQLRSIIYHAQELHDQLNKNDNLPEWVQSKITLAQDYVQTACDYMYSQKNEEVVQEKRGLWDNIHAKRQRIKNGSGESMRKPGSKGAPSAEDLKNSQVKEEVVAEKIEQMDEAVQIKYHMGTDTYHGKLNGKSFKIPATSQSHEMNSKHIKKHAPNMDDESAGHLAKKLRHYYRNVDHNPAQTYKEEVEQIEEGRPSQQHPIEGHEYHKKSDAELRYILKDAGNAAKAMKDHSPRAESKYLDQVNDASTVLSFRQRNGTPAWYKKKYDHVKESVDTPPFTPDAPKKNLGVVVGKRPEGMSKARHLARLAMKGELNKKKTVKEDSAPDVEKTNTPAKRTVSKTTMIVKDAAKSSKEKNKDKFEAEPELSSQIVRNNF